MFGSEFEGLRVKGCRAYRQSSANPSPAPWWPPWGPHGSPMGPHWAPLDPGRPARGRGPGTRGPQPLGPWDQGTTAPWALLIVVYLWLPGTAKNWDPSEFYCTLILPWTPRGCTLSLYLSRAHTRTRARE